MGYMAYLMHGNVVALVESHEDGPKGSPMHEAARIGITRNYRDQFKAVFDGLDFQEALGGRKAQEVIPLLERAVNRLGDDPDELYLLSTPGNAGHVLAILLKWARLHPTAVFSIFEHD